MSDADKMLLRKNRVPLIKYLNIDTLFLGVLYAHDILTETSIENILHQDNRYTYYSSKAGKFLDLLPKRGPLAFQAFIHALMTTGQNCIAEGLIRQQATGIDAKEFIKSLALQAARTSPSPFCAEEIPISGSQPYTVPRFPNEAPPPYTLHTTETNPSLNSSVSEAARTAPRTANTEDRIITGLPPYSRSLFPNEAPPPYTR